MNKKQKKLNSIFILIVLLIVTQTFAADRYWIGNNGNKNWNTTANWSATSGGAGGESVPKTTDNVYFDGGGVGQCVLDANVTVLMLTMNGGYTDTLKQNSKLITIGGGLILNAGTFLGDTGNITINGGFTLTGGSFKSTASLLYLSGKYTCVGATFLHNNGTVIFRGVGSLFGASDFYDVTFTSSGSSVGTTYTIDASSTINVVNSFSTAGNSLVRFDGGAINVQGDLTQNNVYANGGGTGTININGSGDQIFTGQQAINVIGDLCNIRIDKSGGTLFLKQFVSVRGTWEYVAGMVDDSTFDATLSFPNGTGGSYSHTIKGTQIINRLFIGHNGQFSNFTVNAGDVLTVRGSITTSRNYTNFSGSIKLLGDFYSGGNAGSESAPGTGTIEFCGTGDQILSGTEIKNAPTMPSLVINKPSGTLILKKIISVAGNWTWQQGAIDAATYKSTVVFLRGYKTISGTHSLYNVCFYSNYTNVNTIPISDVLTVTGELSFESPAAYSSWISGGTVKALGNITATNSGFEGASTGKLLITGEANQLFTGATTNTTGSMGNIVIDKGAGILTLKNYIISRGNWTYLRGTIDGQTNNSTVVFAYILNGKTISGTHSLYNVVFNADKGISVSTIPASDILTVKGELKFMGAYAQNFNTGTIYAQGDITMTSVSTLGGGTGLININGTSNQTLTGSGIVNRGRLCNINISKTAGTLTLASVISVAGNWTYGLGSAAIFDPGVSTLVFPSGTRTISGNFPLNNLTIFADANSFNYINATDTITVNGEFKTDGPSNTFIHNGTINAKGDFTINNAYVAVPGTPLNTGLINICGNSNQTITGVDIPNKGILGNFTIDKSQGTVFLKNFITVCGDFKHLSGVVDAGTSTLCFSKSIYKNNFQLPYNNVYVWGSCILNSKLDIKGNLKIYKGTFFNTNVQPVLIGGNYDNGNVISATGSIITFNGLGDQTIEKSGGATLIETLSGLEINKPSGKLYLKSPLNLINALTLTKGVVVSTASKYIKLNDNAVVTGASNQSYVAGPVIKTGDEAFTFPLGDTTLTNSYHPLSISATAAITNSYTAQYFAKDQLTDHPTFTPIQTSLNKISNCEYWSLTRNAGTAVVTPTLGWNANSCNINALSDLRVGSWNGTEWIDLGQNATTGTQTIGTVTANVAGPSLANQYYVLGGVVSTKPIASFFASNARTLPPTVEWTKTYGGAAWDEIRDVIETVDGDYIFAGTTYSSASGDIPGTSRGQCDYWVGKTNATGTLLWSKNIGSQGYDALYAMTADPDGGCTVVGSAGSGSGDFMFPGSGSSDIVVVKLSANGDIVWSKLIGGDAADLAFRVMHLKSGELLMFGLSASATGVISGANNGGSDGILVKMDNTGNVIWTKIFASPGFDFISGVVELPTGELVISGTLSTANAEDYFIAKLTSSGDLIWQKTYGGSSDDDANAITKVQGGFVLTGYSHSIDGDVGPNNGGSNAWTIKTDDSGNLMWKSVFGGSGKENCQTVVSTPEGGTIGFGQTNSNDFGVTTSQNSLDNLLVKYNTIGQLEWHAQFGGPFEERIYNVRPTRDGGYIAASGYVATQGEVAPGRGNGDALLVKFSAPPATACIGSSITFSNTSLNATSYLWKVNNVSAGTSANLTYTFTTAGNYTVSLTATNAGVTDVRNLQVVISGDLAANAGPSVTTPVGSGIPIGGNPTATGGVSPYTYAWTPVTGLSDAHISNPLATVAAATTYTVLVNDAAGCSATSTVEVTIGTLKFYASLKNELDAGYYQVNSTDHMLYFNYNEEYKAGNLNYKIYDNSHTLKSCPTVISKQYGDNRFGIDLQNCLGASTSTYYVLEVLNDKEEKLMLRFKY